MTVDDMIDPEVWSEYIIQLCEDRGISLCVGSIRELAREVLKFDNVGNEPDKIYISGPMTGKPGLNGKEFHETERQIIDAGKVAVNPHRISDDVDIKCSEFGTVATYEDYMHADLKALLDGCTTIYMLEGWEDSRGACMEHDVAKICGIEIIYQNEACK